MAADTVEVPPAAALVEGVVATGTGRTVVAVETVATAVTPTAGDGTVVAEAIEDGFAVGYVCRHAASKRAHASMQGPRRERSTRLRPSERPNL